MGLLSSQEQVANDVPHIFKKKLYASQSANIIPWYCESVTFSSLLLSESYWNINWVPYRWHKIQHLLGTSLLIFIPRGLQENRHHLPQAPAPTLGGHPLTSARVNPSRALEGFPKQPSWLRPALITVALGGNITEVSLSWIKRFMLFYYVHKNYSNREQHHDHPWVFALRLFPTDPLSIFFSPSSCDLLYLCPRGHVLTFPAPPPPPWTPHAEANKGVSSLVRGPSLLSTTAIQLYIMTTCKGFVQKYLFETFSKRQTPITISSKLSLPPLVL